MQDYIIAAILIAVGIYYLFFKQPSEPEDLVVLTDKDGADEIAENEAVTKIVKVTKGDVSKLSIPSNFPQEVEIYFGSQTGTAEKFARVLEEEAADLGVIAKVVDMEDFDKEEFVNTELAIIVAATHGEGDPTDNAMRMHTWLKKSVKAKENSLLKNVNYSVFALGDSEYEKFCAAGKFFDKAIGDLGGKRVYELGLGNTSADLEGDFGTWKEGLWSGLIEHWTKLAPAEEEDKKQPVRAKIEKSKYPLKMVPYTGEEQEQQIGPLCIRQYVGGKDVKIDSIRECRQTDKYGSCLEVIYDLEGTGLKYETAANLAVFAENTPKDVERVAKRFGLDINEEFVFQNAEGDTEKRKHPFPTPCTVGEALTRYCELRGPVDRKIFKDLSEFAKDEHDKKELLRLNQNEAKEDIELMKQELVNVMDIMEEYKSLEISCEVLLQVLPKMMPRYYTIASSSKLSPTKVRIAISLSEYKSKKGKPFIGLASDYFKRVYESNFRDGKTGEVKSRIFFKDSLFRIPQDPKVPLIMVGPGTGVVPFIAFAEERQYLKSQNPDVELGVAELYFGCKHRAHDYIYKDELAKFKEDGFLSKVHEAFSREQESKVYVQDLLRLQAETTRDLILNHNAHIYMCGASNMGRSVEKTLEEIIGKEGNEYLTKMKDSKRFAKELWSA